MWVYLPWASRLPSTYQEVEWIGSSATQYMTTGYTPTINTEIETELSWWSSQQTWWVFFWMTSNDNWQDGICGRIYSSSPTIFNPRFLNSAYSECQITTTTDTFHKVILKKNYCTLDWTAWTLTTTYSSPYNWAIYLFCGNNWGSAWRHTSVKFKSFKISESWTLQRNFVPCYRKSDNVIWMYDTVNNNFYTNSWSWTFTKWADVSQGELSNAFIGYAYSPWENTIAYFPLSVSTTTKDQSWKWYQLTTSWSVSFWTYGWVSCCTINNGMLYTQLSSAVSSANWLTMNIRYYETTAPTNDNATLTWMTANTPTWWSVVPIWILRAKWQPNSRQWLIWYLDTYQNNAWTAYSTVASSVSTWRRYNVWVTYQWTTITLYVNWSSIWTVSASDAVANKNYIAISRSIDANRSLIWYVSEAIYEKWVWNATKMAKHYNWMKSLYWLS